MCPPIISSLNAVWETPLFLLHVPLNFHTPVNADGSTEPLYSEHADASHSSGTDLYLRRHNTIKNRTKPGWVTAAGITLVFCSYYRTHDGPVWFVMTCVLTCVCVWGPTPHRGCAWVLEACCNMKENENRGWCREGSGGAASNTAAMTSDPAQSSDAKESSSCHQSKRRVNWELESRGLRQHGKSVFECVGWETGAPPRRGPGGGGRWMWQPPINLNSARKSFSDLELEFGVHL